MALYYFVLVKLCKETFCKGTVELSTVSFGHCLPSFGHCVARVVGLRHGVAWIVVCRNGFVCVVE